MKDNIFTMGVLGEAMEISMKTGQAVRVDEVLKKRNILLDSCIDAE